MCVHYEPLECEEINSVACPLDGAHKLLPTAVDKQDLAVCACHYALIKMVKAPYCAVW